VSTTVEGQRHGANLRGDDAASDVRAGLAPDTGVAPEPAAAADSTLEHWAPAGAPAFTPVPAPSTVDADPGQWGNAPPAAPVRAAGASGRRPVRRGRRVKRVIRRIELWSVLKLCLVLYTCLYVAALATAAVLWGLAYSSGQIENLQQFLADAGLDNFRFYGDQMFRALAAAGAVGVLAGTVLTVLTAALVNLISEMTGGVRLVVIEEDPSTER
jgi:hypothetical protein